MMAPSILVVEDERLVAQDICEELREAGYSVGRVVCRGEDVIDAVRASRPELVLMDICLDGGMDGIDAADRIRREHGVPVIYLTAHADEQTLHRAGRTLPVGYLVKPYTRDSLRSAIQTGLRIHQEETRLAQHAQWYRAVADSACDWDYWLDQDGCMQYVSPSCEEITGYRPEEFQRDPGLLLRIVHPEDAGRVGEAFAKAGADAGAIDFRIVTRRGQTRWIAHVCKPVTLPDGRYRGRRCRNRDITERKRIEAEQDHIQEKLWRMQKLESLGALAGGVAHDFNNLLTVILGNADVAMMAPEDREMVVESLAEIRKAASQASSLSEQMLSYSGRGRFAIRPLLLPEVLSGLLDLVRSSIPPRISLDFVAPDDIPYIEADASQIRQVIMNLIVNATEAIGEEAGTVSLRVFRVHASREDLARTLLNGDLPEGQYVCLEITDTGCGMDESTRRRMFDPFFSTKFTGRGLGLAVVLGIIRGHKGTLCVDSEVGRGTTIKALLPACEFQPVAARETDQARKPPARDKASLTVLVADDQPHVLRLATSILRRDGCRTIQSPDGNEAVRLLRRHREDVDVVLLDYTMPGPDAAATIRRIHELRPDLPVVLCSGYDAEHALQCVEPGTIAGFVQKPYSALELASIIRRVAAV
jgi:PAS domain S-box-containing protein